MIADMRQDANTGDSIVGNCHTQPAQQDGLETTAPGAKL